MKRQMDDAVYTAVETVRLRVDRIQSPSVTTLMTHPSNARSTVPNPTSTSTFNGTDGPSNDAEAPAT